MKIFLKMLKFKLECGDNDTMKIEAIKRYLESYEQRRKEKFKSLRKTKSALNATEHRSKVARDKITNAVNYLRMENKKINMNSVAKFSGCSINTVKKYKDFIEKNQNNK